MTKVDIVSEISKNTGIDKATAISKRWIFMDIVKNSLSQGDNVYLKRIWKFRNQEKSSKQLVIFPKTRQSLFRNTNIPSFKPAKNILNEVK